MCPTQAHCVEVFWVPDNPSRPTQGHLEGQKGPKKTLFSPLTELTAATPPKFRSFHPLELFRLIHLRPNHDPFFAENPFSPADEAVFNVHGAGGTKLTFRCNTACAKARRLENHFICICNVNFTDVWAYQVLERINYETQLRTDQKLSSSIFPCCCCASVLFKDIKNDITMSQTRKYKNTNTKKITH